MSWNSSHIILCRNGVTTVIAGGDKIASAQPRFSPNGEFISYLSDVNGWLNLYMCNKEGKEHGTKLFSLSR